MAAAKDSPHLPEVDNDEHGEPWVCSQRGGIVPGIHYTIAAARRAGKGRWAYMANEGSQIYRGYRIGLSFTQCLKSMFQLHNETVNVWSHLLGCMVFLCLVFYVSDSQSLARPRAMVQRVAMNIPEKLSFVPRCGIDLASSASCDDRPFANESLSSAKESLSYCEAKQESERQAFSSASRHFDAARDILKLVEFKLPGLQRWREVLQAHTRDVTQNLAAEAKQMKHQLEEQMINVDHSLNAIREELKHLGTASMEGCVVCWAELVRKLSGARMALQEQMATLGEKGVAENLPSHVGWGLSMSEWSSYTAAELSSLSLALNTGISAARRALQHASENIHHEIQHELHAFRELDLFHEHGVEEVERWPIVVFLVSGCVCLLTSASYHLFNCHSLSLNNLLLLLDYAGISVLICGSFIPPVFYGFYCDSTLRSTYLALIVLLSLTSSVVGVYSGLYPSRFFRLARVLCYSANAMFAVFPMGHLFLRWMVGSDPCWTPCLVYIACMLGLYALGTVIYTYQFPEKYWPERFDLLFSSHQLWHIIVFSAAFLHYFCAIGHFLWRQDNRCPAPGMDFGAGMLRGEAL